jgi:hypothetical protein
MHLKLLNSFLKRLFIVNLFIIFLLKTYLLLQESYFLKYFFKILFLILINKKINCFLKILKGVFSQQKVTVPR